MEYCENINEAFNNKPAVLTKTYKEDALFRCICRSTEICNCLYLIWVAEDPILFDDVS